MCQYTTTGTTKKDDNGGVRRSVLDSGGVGRERKCTGCETGVFRRCVETGPFELHYELKYTVRLTWYPTRVICDKDHTDTPTSPTLPVNLTTESFQLTRGRLSNPRTHLVFPSHPLKWVKKPGRSDKLDPVSKGGRQPDLKCGDRREQESGNLNLTLMSAPKGPRTQKSTV